MGWCVGGGSVKNISNGALKGMRRLEWGGDVCSRGVVASSINR